MDLIEKVRKIAYTLIPTLEIDRGMVLRDSYTVGFGDMPPKLARLVLESWPESERMEEGIGMTLLQFPSGGQLVVITEGPVEGDGSPVAAVLAGKGSARELNREEVENLL